MAIPKKFRIWWTEEKEPSIYYEDALCDDTWTSSTPRLIEQYTGLKDKNGKDIYEGDIIQETILADDTTDGTYRYEVYWDDDMLCWSIKGISDIDYHLRDDLWETNASREVIGNIHEKDKLVDFDHVEGGEE